jgi:hypothetical protein
MRRTDSGSIARAETRRRVNPAPRPARP